MNLAFPRLKRTIEPVDGPDREIVMVRSNGFKDVRITNLGEPDRALIAALDGSRSVAELESSFGVERVKGALTGMREMDLVEDAADDRLIPPADLERYDRQLLYFSDLASGAGMTASQCQARLTKARVAVLGLGGLGGRIALELACCGVGELRIVDGDRVELSNLHRQMLHEVEDIGRPKAAVAGEKLARAAGPAIEVRAERLTANNVQALIDGMDAVIDATDYTSTKFLLNDACVEAGIPLVHAGVVGFTGQLLAILPGEGPCLRCLFPEPPSEGEAATCRDGGILGPVAGFIGLLEARTALEMLAGDAEPRFLRFDGRSLALRSSHPRRSPTCPVCADSPIKRGRTNEYGHRPQVP